MTDQNHTVRFTLRLDPPLYNLLKAQADNQHRSVASLTRHLLYLALTPDSPRPPEAGHK